MAKTQILASDTDCLGLISSQLDVVVFLLTFQAMNSTRPQRYKVCEIFKVSQKEIKSSCFDVTGRGGGVKDTIFNTVCFVYKYKSR